jgi:IclR family transcriptional regulator, KDG regulon repressor
MADPPRVHILKRRCEFRETSIFPLDSDVNIHLAYEATLFYNVKRMGSATTGSSGVLVLHKTIDILEALRQAPAGLPLSEITARLRMPKATIFRILATLESRGYLDRSSSGEYRIARKLLELNGEDTSAQALIRAARAPMQKLLEACRETLNLGVLDGGEVLVIETLESPQAVRMSSKIGNRRYPHSTALGKVLLAGLPEREVLRILKMRGMPKFTDNTLTSTRSVIIELEKVRAQGFAMDNRENEEDGRCIAAPVFGAARNVVGALSISGPIPRMTLSRARGLVKQLCAACQEISSAMGARPRAAVTTAG